jgi:hypothetical protein
MKHVILALLTYAIAVMQTSHPFATTSLNPMTCVAACALVILSHQPALVWLLVIGLVSDLTGSGLIGTTALTFVGVGFLFRAMVSNAHESPLYVTAGVALGFTVMVNLPRLLQTTTNIDGLLSLATSVLLTWLVVTTVLVLRRTCLLFFSRFKQQSVSGGAMGTPVGLEVR